MRQSEYDKVGLEDGIELQLTPNMGWLLSNIVSY